MLISLLIVSLMINWLPYVPLSANINVVYYNYSQNTFFEALSEIHLLFFFSVFGPSEIIKATYEPPLGPNRSNPEARFEYADGTILDLEIKTPKFPPRGNLKNTVLPCLLLDDTGREELNLYCQQHDLSCQFPRILKFKDFFASAAKSLKFPLRENILICLLSTGPIQI